MNLHDEAERLNIPRRTVEDVRKALTAAAKRNADKSMVRLMLNHGRLTDDARAFVAEWLAAA